MANGKYVSYLRVSTIKQGVSGLGLEAQRTAVTTHLNGGSWKIVAELVEVESGKRNDRPELKRAMRLCRLHGATLLVAKLDRLSRNVAFLATLMEEGVPFTAADMPEADQTHLHMMAVFAQHEARAISNRTKAALAAAKARGKKLGGRRVSEERFAEIAAAGRVEAKSVRAEAIRKRREDLVPVIEDIRLLGATTLTAIAEELNVRGISAARGGQWTPVQVQRVIGQRRAVKAAPGAAVVAA